ncbi:MAG: HNH endonuclease, partial [Actinomycetota bacterium]|nr:HNH endonuclease [Actinomycetota bacterium]
MADLDGWLDCLSHPSPAADDAARIDRIDRLERLKAAAAAAQAREAVAFKASQLAEQGAAGVSARDLGKGIGAQVALARRESPYLGARLVGLAEALVRELPHTMAALTAGTISEWRATLVARESACLSADDR